MVVAGVLVAEVHDIVVHETLIYNIIPELKPISGNLSY